MAKDVCVITRSLNKERIFSNIRGPFDAYKKLTPEDIKALDGIAAAGKQKRLVLCSSPVDQALTAFHRGQAHHAAVGYVMSMPV